MIKHKTRFIALICMAVLLIQGVAYGYALMGHKWQNDTCKLNITGLGTWQSDFSTAMSNWNNAGNKKLKFVSDSSSTNNVQCVSGIIGNPQPLAQTGTSYYPSILIGPYTAFASVTIGFNTAVYSFNSGTSGASGKYHFQTVARHELGHALGLLHDDTNSILMKTSVGLNTVRTIGTDDINGLNAIY